LSGSISRQKVDLAKSLLATLCCFFNQLDCLLLLSHTFQLDFEANCDVVAEVKDCVDLSVDGTLQVLLHLRSPGLCCVPTCLIAGAASKSLDVLTYLLSDAGVSPDSVDTDGNTGTL